MKPTIVFIMGPTCSGKSTFLNYCKEQEPDRVGVIEVGKLFRAKYPPEYFEGFAALEKTRQEAWDIFTECLYQNFTRKLDLILVDGQPRDISQVKAVLESQFVQIPRRVNPDSTETILPPITWRKRFFYFYCPREVQQQRAENRHPTGGKELTLAQVRIDNDRLLYHDVLVALMANWATIEVVNTSGDPEKYSKRLLDTMLDGAPYIYS